MPDERKRVAIVTGGSRGIGRATVLKLAAEGYSVAAVYSSNKEAAESLCQEAKVFGATVKAYKCNVGDFKATRVLVDNIVKEFGNIDVLVNNAGITKDGLIMRMKESDFDDVLNVNLKGAFNMIRHCTPVFVKNRYGRIINISSIAGIMGNAGQANYAASKAGLIGLTKSVARELAMRNVCCNAIAPGFISTDMTAEIDDANILLGNIPMRRLGLPEEVADLVCFLAGDSAGYITGEVVRIDGGLAM